jgi:hypothetical protein
MSKIEKFIREYSWSFCLGAGATIISGKGIGDWQWWAFVVPVIVLVDLRPKN